MARRSLCATLTASGAPLRCATGHNLAALHREARMVRALGSCWDLTCLGKPLLLSLNTKAMCRT